MIIRCQYCKREFDKPSYRNQHVRDTSKDGPGGCIRNASDRALIRVIKGKGRLSPEEFHARLDAQPRGAIHEMYERAAPFLEWMDVNDPEFGRAVAAYTAERERGS